MLVKVVPVFKCSKAASGVRPSGLTLVICVPVLLLYCVYSAMDTQKIAFGIDLWTTNSCVAVAKDRHNPETILIEGEETIPSIVTFEDSHYYIGKEALGRQRLSSNSASIRTIKSVMGRTKEELKSNNELMLIWYRLVAGDPSVLVETTYKNNKRTYYQEFISALILDKIELA